MTIPSEDIIDVGGMRRARAPGDALPRRVQAEVLREFIRRNQLPGTNPDIISWVGDCEFLEIRRGVVLITWVSGQYRLSIPRFRIRVEMFPSSREPRLYYRVLEELIRNDAEPPYNEWHKVPPRSSAWYASEYFFTNVFPNSQ